MEHFNWSTLYHSFT